MKTITVKTGFGYFSKDGYIIAKAELPPGEHTVDDDYNYIEVNSKSDLKQIGVYCDPVEAAKVEAETKIRNKIREIAVQQLKAEGEIPQDYK